MSHLHEVVKCSCGAILRQCRCMNPAKLVTVLPAACERCKGRPLHELIRERLGKAPE
jgi:hypothetical protein